MLEQGKGRNGALKWERVCKGWGLEREGAEGFWVGIRRGTKGEGCCWKEELI